eukprot:403346333
MSWVLFVNYGVSGYGAFADPTTCFTQKQLPIMIEGEIGDNYHTTSIEVDSNQNLIFGGMRYLGPYSTYAFIGFYFNSPAKSRLKWLNVYYLASAVTTYNTYFE